MFSRVSLLFILLSISLVRDVQSAPCQAVRTIDLYYNERFSFDIPLWADTEFVGVSNVSGIDPMTGTWSYSLQLCNSLNVLMGDATMQPPTTLFGFSHGKSSRFVALAKTIRLTPINKPSPIAASPSSATEEGIEPNQLTPNPHVHDNVKEFILYYENGDTGAPCSPATPRAAQVHIWCAYTAKSCSGIPGAQANETPYAGNISNGYGLCGIVYNTSLGICKGLELHLLSNSCPTGQFIPRTVKGRGGSVMSASAQIALVVCGVFALILCVIFFTCWGYRASVLGRKGVTALPGYDLIPQRGTRGAPIMDIDTSVGASSGKSGYGSL